MFSVGDLIIYGSMGVCTVTDIRVTELPGSQRECYVLKPHYVANSTVYAPVEGNPVKMRHLLEPSQIQALIDGLPGIEPFPISKEKQEMYNIYRGAIKSADCLSLAKLLKTLYEKKMRLMEQRKIIPSAEKEYFDTAEKMLYGEVASALQMPIDEVQDYIYSQLDSGYSNVKAAVS